MRKTPFVNGEFYHIYNRGIDKRILFSDETDVERFVQSMSEFNKIEPIGSIYENSFRKEKANPPQQLVKFISYCVNPNHFHFLLEQLVDRGIEKFLHRLGTGYTKYFNNRHSRSGSLFQGPFKAIHLESNEYLLHLSVYVNLNDRIHQLGSLASKLVDSRSSWTEYIEGRLKIPSFCDTDIILGQFSSKKDYEIFAEEALQSIIERKDREKELAILLLE